MTVSDMELSQRLFNTIESPTHFVTVKPMTPFITPINMVGVLDTTNERMLRKAFGRNYKWKKHRMRKPKWFLQPESDSSKCVGSSYVLLHYHGIVQIENVELAKSYEDHFEVLFTQEVDNLRMRMRDLPGLQRPEVKFDTYDQRKDCVGYTLKQNTVTYDHGDAYVYGRESKHSL